MTESFGAYPAEQTMAPAESAPLPFTPAITRPPGLIRPAPLVKGDTIGVVAPSYAAQQGWLLRGASAIEEAGYKVILCDEIGRLRLFPGPTLDDLFPGGTDPSARSLLTALTTPRPETELGREIARAVRPGSAVGRLTGGNLSLVQQTIGTPYEIDTRDAILFLEETHDPMSVADERLLHLRAAGLLHNVRGIVFGQLSLDRSEEDEFEDFLLDLVSDLEVPIVMDFPAGHEVPNLTLPLGTEVELIADETTGWLSYREDALATSEERPRLSLV